MTLQAQGGMCHQLADVVSIDTYTSRSAKPREDRSDANFYVLWSTRKQQAVISFLSNYVKAYSQARAVSFLSNYVKAYSQAISFLSNEVEAQTRPVLFEPTSNLWYRSIQPISSNTHRLNQFIAATMEPVDRVERIYSKNTTKVFYTWIVFKDRDEEALDTIYQLEEWIIDRFPEFEFDFYVIYRKEMPIDSLVSGNVELIFSRSQK